MKPSRSKDAMFAVSLVGLRNLAQRRTLSQTTLELIQNSLDAGSTKIDVTVTGKPRGDRCHLSISVEDNAPKGWVNLDEAYTLFTPSIKGPSAELRGRFNLGEKLFIALTDRCEITSVAGGLLFEKGYRTANRTSTRTCGTLIEAEIRSSPEMPVSIVEQLLRVIVPAGVVLTVNTIVVKVPKIEASTEVTLRTEVAGPDGVLRGSNRRTRVNVVSVHEGEPAMLYEMGIPICESGDRYHYNVHQRVPLGMDREAPKLSYLRTVRAAALEALAQKGLLDKATAGDAWVREALEHREVSPAAARAFADAALGSKAVAYDPSDPEANHLAVAAGYRVVHGGSFTKQAWQHLRSAEVILPAGQVTPSPKPYSKNGSLLKTREPLTEELPTVAYIQRMAEVLLGRKITLTLAVQPDWPFRATYGPSGHLTLNVPLLAEQWWNLADADKRQDLDDLLIHEYGHNNELNHLSEGYYNALTKLGAKLARAIRAGEIS